MHEHRRPLGKFAECIEELDHPALKSHCRVDFCRPAIVRRRTFRDGIDEVKHFLAVALSLGQLPIVIPKRIVSVAHHRHLAIPGRFEERSRPVPCRPDQVVESVTAQQEEPVVTTGEVERSEHRIVGLSNIDRRHQVRSFHSKVSQMWGEARRGGEVRASRLAGVVPRA